MKKQLTFLVIITQIYAFSTFAQQGQTLNFDFNANTNVSLVNNIQLADSFTIEAWIYPIQKNDFSTIIGNKSPGIASPGYFLAINNYASNNGKIVFETQNATNTSIASVNWNQWQHIAITWDGSLVRMYINGSVQTLNDSLYMNLQPSLSPTYIGDIPAYIGNGNYHGNLDELRVWNYAKSQQELQANMFCQLGNSHNGLLAYYQFNEGIASGNNAGLGTLPDLSGNNNTGNLVNFGLNGSSSNYIAPGGVNNITLNQNIVSCEGTTIIVGNNAYTIDGTYTDTLMAFNGCDSIVTTTLVFNSTSSFSQSFTICNGDSVTVGNSTYFSSGNYTSTLINANGCDSIVNTSITVNIPNVNITQLGNTLIAEPGASSYQWIICDSVFSILPNETNEIFSPFLDGNYAVLVTLGNCISQSICTPIVLTSIDKSESNDFNLFPNPAIDFILLNHQNQMSNYTISNLQGIVIAKGLLTNKLEKIQVSNFQSGMYFISIEDGKHISFVKK